MRMRDKVFQAWVLFCIVVEGSVSIAAGQKATELAFVVPPQVWYLFMGFLVGGSALALAGTVVKTCVGSLISESVGLNIALIGLTVFVYDRTSVIVHQLDLQPRWIDFANIAVIITLGIVLAHRRFRVAHLLRVARHM